MSSEGTLGILVVHNDPVPEREIWRTIGFHHSVVVARFGLNRPAGEEYRGETVEDFLTPDVQQRIGWLTDAGAQAVALCFVSASVVGPPGFDSDFTAAIRETYGIHGYTAGEALRGQIRARAPRDALVVFPPWFTDETVHRTRTYLAECTDASLSAYRFRLPASWDTTRRQDLFDDGAKGQISPSELLAQTKSNLTPATDLVIVPGSGFATSHAFVPDTPHLPPTLTANGAVAQHFDGWHAETHAPGTAAWNFTGVAPTTIGGPIHVES